MEIPDPIEIMEMQIDREEAKIDSVGNYPCARCDKRVPVEETHPWGASPSSPGVCGECLDVLIQESG